MGASTCVSDQIVFGSIGSAESVFSYTHSSLLSTSHFPLAQDIVPLLGRVVTLPQLLLLLMPGSRCLAYSLLLVTGSWSPTGQYHLRQRVPDVWCQ